MRQALVFTQDCQLFNSLQQRCEASSYTLRFCETAVEVSSWIKQFTLSTLFLDVRPGRFDHAIVSLVEELLTGKSRLLNVIPISDGTLPCEIAGPLTLLAATHLIVDDVKGKLLDWPSESETPLEQVLAADRPRLLPQACILQGSDTRLTTYEPTFFQVLEDLKRVAHRDVTLLLVGETGTGKTTLARIIHERSRRKDQGFQQLACGALPEELIESELFGHVRGAFTGADRNKIGRFQAAGKGTLLLDEIDVLDVKQQAKLLKVIETGEYELVGSTESQYSEARLITASNLQLEELTSSNRFRSDLYYRLSVLEFRLLPLRSRRIDIVPMAADFLNECCREHEIEIHSVGLDFLQAIQRYSWPGNIRELKNHIRRAVLFAENGRLTAADLSTKVTEIPTTPSFIEPEYSAGQSLAAQVAENERELLLQALETNRHNRTRTAQALGISRVGLYKKMRRLGLLDNAHDEVMKRAS